MIKVVVLAILSFVVVRYLQGFEDALLNLGLHSEGLRVLSVENSLFAQRIYTIDKQSIENTITSVNWQELPLFIGLFLVLKYR